MIESLGPYRLLDPIGPSAVAEVFRARDTRLGRTVALYVLTEHLCTDPEAFDRLLRVARSATALSHPNIATLFEVGNDGGRWFLAFEFVPGVTLRRMAGGQPLPVRRAIDLAVQIVDALAEGHARGIAHGGVSLDSVIVTPKGRAKIIEFGLAAWQSGDSRGQAPASEDADVLAAGAVLYELLTARPPFGDSRAALAASDAPASPPSRMNRNVPEALDAIVLRALSMPVETRFDGAAACAGALRSVEATLPSPELDRVPLSARGSRNARHPIRWAVAAALVGVAIAGMQTC